MGGLPVNILPTDQAKIETPVENCPSTYWTITFQTTCMMRCQMDYMDQQWVSNVFACRRTGAGVFVHSDEAWQTVTAMAAGQVDASRVGLAVMHLGCTLINIWGQQSTYSRLITQCVALYRHTQDTRSDSSSSWLSKWMKLNEQHRHCCVNLSTVSPNPKMVPKFPSLIPQTNKTSSSKDIFARKI